MTGIERRMEQAGGQGRILALCWLTYTLAYTLRVNIAVVIPVLVAERHYTYTQMGLVTSLYFVTYMLGQLVNGYLGDRVSSKRLIMTGLVFSALCNLGMALAPNLAVAAICWGLNGLAQSMLWAPIMKTLSVWFAGYQLERVSFIMSMSMIIGYALSWGASSLLTSRFGWQYAFYIPAGLIILQVLALLLFFLNTPAKTDLPLIGAAGPSVPTAPGAASDAAPDQVMPILAFFKLIRLPGLLLIALTQGLIREGISTWFPTILQESGRFAAGSPLLILIIVPLINLGGILFVRQINRRLNGACLQTLLLVFALVTVCALLMNLFLAQWFWLILLMIVLLLALTYGMTPILTSVIPFQFAQYKRVALTAGVIDFAIYLGAALSGLVSGLVADHFAWSGVMLLWLAAAVVGLSVSLSRFYKNKGRKQYEQKIHNQS